MKLKELQIAGGTVYLNIVHADETETKTMTATAAVKKYGELEVMEHHPYEGTTEVPAASTAGKSPKRGKEPARPGTDVVILKGE